MKKLIWLFLLSAAFGQLSPADKNAISINGHVIISGTVSIQSQAPFLESIAVTPTAPSIAVGGTQQFGAQGNYSDGSTFDLTTIATWNSASPSIATINSSGVATGVSAGTSNITASYQGLTSNTAVLTVTSAPTFTITTTTCPNATQNSAYTCTIHSQNGTGSCTWTVSVGSLPTGLTLNSPSNPCDPTTITGTPTVLGTSNFTVQGTDGGSHVATQALSITVNSSSPTCGPATYPCSSTDSISPCPQLGTGTCTFDPATGKATANSVSTASRIMFQASDPVNTTLYDTSLNPSGTNCITQVTDENTFGAPATGLTYDGGSGTQQFSLNGDFFTVAFSNLKVFKGDPSGTCYRVVWPVPGSKVTDAVKPNAVFSSVTDNLIYEEDTSSTAVLDHRTITGSPNPTSLSAATQDFDFSWSPHTPGAGTKPLNTAGFASGGSDNAFWAGFSWSQFGECSGQGCAHTAYYFKKSTHQAAALQLTDDGSTSCTGGNPCLVVNLYDFCDPDANGHSSDHLNCQNATAFATIATTIPYSHTAKNSGFHGAAMDPSGLFPSAGFQDLQSPAATQVFWSIGNGAHVGTTIGVCPAAGGNNCTGHGKTGETGYVAANNPYITFNPHNNFAPPWPGNSVNVAGPFAGFNKCEMHPAWENSTADDTWYSTFSTSVCDQSTYGLTLTSPYQNEMFGVKATGSGSAPARFFHNGSTGNPGSPAGNTCGANFTCVYNQHYISQDGKWMAFGSSQWGSLGINPKTLNQIGRIFIGRIQ